MTTATETKKEREIKDRFYAYLEKLGLFRIRIWTDKTSVYAELATSDKPRKVGFTQILKNTYYPTVRLSFKDLHNREIVGDFFKGIEI